MNSNPPLLSSAYLPPVSYMAIVSGHSRVIIERDENYKKQSYRNRCCIMSANGVLALSVPVLRGSFHKVALSDIEVDYSGRWIDVHRAALISAYRRSPFFDFYFDQLLSVIEQRPKKLIELNHGLLIKIIELTGIKSSVEFSNSFIRPPGDPSDFRYIIDPKRDYISSFHLPPYIQVFESRYGFVPDLSIVDLLFNMGPETASYLAGVITAGSSE